MVKKRTIQIDYKPRREQVEIHTALDKYRWSVIVAHRRLGKSVCVINHLIKAAVTSKKVRPRFGYIAPQYNQAKTIAWDYLKHYTAKLPRMKINESELSVTFFNGAKIRLFGADNPDNLRGQYFDGAVMDEVAQMKPDVWGEVVAPALIDRQGWVCFIGTPKGINTLSELYHSGLRKEKWFCKVYRANETSVLSKEDLEAAKENMTESQYRQEFECDWTASSDNVLITLDIALKAREAVNTPDMWNWAPIVIGVDVARFGDDSSVIYVRQGLHTLDIQVYNDMDLMALADKVALTIQKYKPARTFIDSVGIGAGLVDRLRQMQFQVIEVNSGASPSSSKYKNKRAECWDEMKKWLIAGGDIPDRPSLMADLTSLTYSFDISDRMVLEKKSDARKRGIPSPNESDALAYTFAFPTPIAERQKRQTPEEIDWMNLTGNSMYQNAVNMEG